MSQTKTIITIVRTVAKLSTYFVKVTIFFLLKKQTFALRTILSENSCHFLICIVLPKNHFNNDYCLSLTQVKLVSQFYRKIWPSVLY